MKLIFLFMILITSFSTLADVVVVTYNMAQLKKNGVDLVACTSRRIQPQLDHMLHLPTAPAHKEKYFVYALQEIWTKKAFNALRTTVDKLGYSMFPRDQKFVKKNGVVTVTNMKILTATFTPYSRDTYAEKGILYTLTETNEGEKIAVLNVHTGFSGKKEVSTTHLRQFYEIGEFALGKKKESDYLVVAGDFNTGSDIVLENQLYPVADATWTDGIIPVMNSVELNHVAVDGVTWDQTSNPLVNKPAFLLRMFNIADHGHYGWGQNDSTMDHIFISNNLALKEADIIFDDPIPLHCPKRTTEDGLSYLSDHYGVMAVVGLKPKAVIGTNP